MKLQTKITVNTLSSWHQSSPHELDSHELLRHLHLLADTHFEKHGRHRSITVTAADELSGQTVQVHRRNGPTHCPHCGGEL